MILVISASLNPESRSFVLAQQAVQEFEKQGQNTSLLDLREHPLPLCDANQAYKHPDVAKLRQKILQANAILIAAPVYNYDLNAAIKNLVELTGSTWENKLVGFLCAAGGEYSYMSVMSFANGLMLDFRCLIVPRFIYAISDDFTETDAGLSISNSKIIQRIEQLVKETTNLSTALKTIPA